MFSWFMIPGLILAIGLTGLVWWLLKEFTRIEPSTADGLSVVTGLLVAFLFSLYYRGLLKEPIQVSLALSVLILSYFLVHFGHKRGKRWNQSKSKKTPPTVKL